MTEVIRSSTGGGRVITEIVEPCVDFEIDIDSASLEEVSSERSVPTSAAPLPKKKRITVESLDSEMDGTTSVQVVNGQITKIFRDLSDMQHSSQEIQELQVLNYDNELVLCSAFTGDSAIAYEAAAAGAELPQAKSVAIIGKFGKGKVAIIDSMSLERKSKLQPLLESFNKSENKVEVERITGSPVTVKEEADARAFLGASTSRQNLETIVEAIRHLEGDRFGEQPKNRNGVVVKTEGGGLAVTTLPAKIVAAATAASSSSVIELPTQEVPLALTTKSSSASASAVSVAQRHAELSPFVQFRTTAAGSSRGATTGSNSSSSSNNNSSAMPKLTTTTGSLNVSLNGQPATIVLHQLQQQQQRPGVIVAKQSS